MAGHDWIGMKPVTVLTVEVQFPLSVLSANHTLLLYSEPAASGFWTGNGDPASHWRPPWENPLCTQALPLMGCA